MLPHFVYRLPIILIKLFEVVLIMSIYMTLICILQVIIVDAVNCERIVIVVYTISG